MCGQSNPDHLESCQHCSARLTPLGDPSESPASEPGAVPEEASEPTGEPAARGPSGEPSGDDADWLSSMRAGDSLLGEEDLEDESWVDSDDWEDLGEDDLAGSILASSPGQEEPGEFVQEEDLEWPSEQQEPADSALQAPGPEDIEAAGEQVAGVGEDLPDWLRAADLETDPQAEIDVPEWMTESSSGIVPGEAEEQPTWLDELAELGAESPQVEPFEAASPFEGGQEGEEELPYWLQGEDEEETTAEPADQVEDWFASPESGAEEEIPEWMRQLQAESDQEPEQVEELDQAAGEFEPDAVLETGEDAGLLEFDIADEEEEDWFSEPGDTPEEAIGLQADAEAATAEPDEPDWLAELGELATGGDEGDLEEPWESEAVAEEAFDLPIDESPSWEEDQVGEGTAADSLEDDLLDFLSADTPETESAPSLGFDIGELESESPPVVQQPGLEPEFDDLRLEKPFRPEGEELPFEAVQPGDLPKWLLAMRPASGQVPGETAVETHEGEIERLGPLSGLRGLLGAEPDITRAGRPPEYSELLEISDLQAERAGLLQAFVAKETESAAVPDAAVVSGQRVLRWIVLVGLLVSVIVPLLMQTQFNSLPGTTPDEARALARMINGLGDQAPVLIAFDYEPGLSGELDAAAAAVIDHLMLRGTRMAVVSTSPIGPAVAERFLANAPGDHDYRSGEQYTNLGYIAGGPSGLLNFSLDPKATTVVAFDDRPIWQLLLSPEEDSPWNQEPLQGVSSVFDFSMTLVITDDPDVARIWIEQVQPRLQVRSLAMIVSAQAGPLVRPYFGEQVSGLLVGMAGGMAYEQHLGRFPLARLYWEPFGISMLFAALLVLAGSSYNLYLLYGRRNPEAE